MESVNEVAKNLSASNNSISVNKPEIPLHNPNIKVPSEIGTGIGIGGAVSAGIYGLSKSRAIKSMPMGTRAGALALGGILGGGTFVAANYFNTVAQKNANSSCNTSVSNNENDSYPTKSIIGEGDDISSVMYNLNLNIIICMVVLLLFLLLTYLYLYKRNNIIVIYII